MYKKIIYTIFFAFVMFISVDVLNAKELFTCEYGDIYFVDTDLAVFDSYEYLRDFKAIVYDDKVVFKANHYNNSTPVEIATKNYNDDRNPTVKCNSVVDDCDSNDTYYFAPIWWTLAVHDVTLSSGKAGRSIHYGERFKMTFLTPYEELGAWCPVIVNAREVRDTGSVRYYTYFQFDEQTANQFLSESAYGLKGFTSGWTYSKFFSAKRMYHSSEVTDDEWNQMLVNANIFTTEVLSSEIIGYPTISTTVGFCVDYLGSADVSGTVANMLDKAYDIMKYIAIIICIVLAMVDLAGTITKGSDDLPNVFKKNGKRIVIVVLILLTPTIIQIIFGLFGFTEVFCGIG